MLPIYSGDLVFFYFSCRLDPCKSLLGSSLLSRFSGIVNCELVFFMFKSHLWVSTCDNCLSVSKLSHSKWCFLAPFIFLQNSRCHFLCCVVLHCVNVPYFPYLFFSQRAFRLFPGSGYNKQCCYEHSWTHVLEARLSILWVYTRKWYYWVLRKVVS